MKNLLKLLSLVLIVTFLSSCDDDDDVTVVPTNTIVDVAVNNNLTSLVAAVTRADLAITLSGDGPFTVFAPTNAAFQALLDSNTDWNSFADLPIEILEAVLLYHVVNEANVQSGQLSNGDVPTLGGTITIDLTNGAQIVTSSDQTVNIIITDVQGTNGVIHGIDTVLIP